MDTHLLRIRFWHLADINEEAERLRSWGLSGHRGIFSRM